MHTRILPDSEYELQQCQPLAQALDLHVNFDASTYGQHRLQPMTCA